MTRKVLKWPVPVDDQQYDIGSGPVLLVDIQGGDMNTVYVWTDEADAEAPVLRKAQVYGTGHVVPEAASPLGSVVAGFFVWHVFAVEGGTPLPPPPPPVEVEIDV